jgi:hypothetical protein
MGINGRRSEWIAAGQHHLGSSTSMRFFVRIFAVLGILALIGLATGAAYSAGLAASGVAQPAAYGLGFAFLGFGLFHFFGFILFVFLFFGLLRLAFGGRRGWSGRGGMGWGHGYGPGGWNQAAGDPREAWIRGRLEEWHKTAHAPDSAGGLPTAGAGSPTAGASDPTSNPPA